MLDAHTITTIKSTLPAIQAAGPALTAHFYSRMFRLNPELKDVFNMSNQRNGMQQEALFNAICAYADHIDNLAVLLPAVERIAQKHTSFSIRPDQYQIVGRHLLATIEEQLTADKAILDAWGKAYGLLANVFIDREEAIYQQTEQKAGGWRGTRWFVIGDIVQESTTIKSVVLIPEDGQPVVSYQPGQYLGVHIDDEDFAHHEIRQYSLTRTANGHDYRIAIRHEEQGLVSGWFHTKARRGDRIQLTPPAGDFVLDVTPETPVTLISAGSGQTPLLAMLHTLAEQHHSSPVNWLHAADSYEARAFGAEVTAAGSQLARFNQYSWYQQPTTAETHYPGRMDISVLNASLTPPATHYYLCGPAGFMPFIARQLADKGVPPSHLHYENFGPHTTL